MVVVSVVLSIPPLYMQKILIFWTNCTTALQNICAKFILYKCSFFDIIIATVFFISYIITEKGINQMKTNNQTTNATTNATQNKLQDLMQERNRIIEWLEYDTNELAQCGEFESINAEIMQTLSEIATYKTLKFLMSNNATHGTATETTDNGTTNTYGYNMALSLFNNLYNDIKLFRNPSITTEIFSNAADLVQESNKTLTPYFCNNVVFSLDDTIYTKTLKNGNIKNYT